MCHEKHEQSDHYLPYLQNTDYEAAIWLPP